MIRHRSALLCVSMLSVITGTASGQDTSCPGNGVTYTEQPERGPYVDKGRALTPSTRAEYGVDINSTIKVLIDPDCIARGLGGLPASQPGAAELEARIDSLTSVLRAIPIAIDQIQGLFRAYAALGAQPDSTAVSTFDSLLRASALTRQRIFRAIRAAAQARLQTGGASDEDIKRGVAAIANAQVAGGDSQGYNWGVITDQLEREVEFVRAELASAPVTARVIERYDIEVRAYLLTSDGQYPFPLSKYNEEQACAATRVDPIQLELPEEEAELFEDFEQLRSKFREVRGVGNVVVAAVSAELDRIKPEMDLLLGRAEGAVAPVETAGKRLLRWGRPGALRKGLEQFNASLAADPALQATADSLGAIVDTLNADLEALRSLGSLRNELATANARSAMVAILGRASAVKQLARPSTLAALQSGTWTARGQLANRFLDRIEALAPALRDKLQADPASPVADALAAGDAMKAAADSLGSVSKDAIALLGRILGLPPALAASNLPEPRGLSRRPLEGDLNTEIRLKELCQPRKENDQVSVEIRVFRGEQEVREQTDRFHLRMFGWRSRVAASLAFYERQHTDTWQPGAAISWIFTHGSWPSSGKPGLGDPAGLGQIGFGLTTVNLHFEDEESIELGIGPSLSFLNDRVVLGAGWNLQASDDQLYWLLSIRLLDVARTH